MKFEDLNNGTRGAITQLLRRKAAAGHTGAQQLLSLQATPETYAEAISELLESGTLLLNPVRFSGAPEEMEAEPAPETTPEAEPAPEAGRRDPVQLAVNKTVDARLAMAVAGMVARVHLTTQTVAEQTLGDIEARAAKVARESAGLREPYRTLKMQHFAVLRDNYAEVLRVIVGDDADSVADTVFNGLLKEAASHR